MSIERSYAEGDQLTLRLIGSIVSDGDDRAAGHVVVSIYEESGCDDCTRPYLVRGHVVTLALRESAEHEAASGAVECRLANRGGGISTIEYAWIAARKMFAQLEAAYVVVCAEPKAGERDVSAAELADAARDAAADTETDKLEALAKVALDELRNRGRDLGIEIERDQHANALSVVERLAASARAVEQIARAKPASNPA